MKSEYALEWLDILISVTLNKKTEAGSQLTPEYAEMLKQKVRNQREEIRFMLMHQIFNVREERMLEILIQQYQSSLVRLIDQLENERRYLSTLEHIKSLTEEIGNVLEDLLSFIELYFTKYYNLEQTVPASYLTINKRGWSGQFKKVKPALEKINTSLGSLLLKIMATYVNASQLTFRQMIYGKDLYQEVIKSVNYISTSNYFFTPLEDALIYLNFNHALFVAMLIQKIEQEIDNLLDQELKNNRLHFYQNELETFPIKPGASYNVSLPAVTASLGQWINFQINN